MITPEILFEDEVLLVISKPAGMVVNRADTTEIGKTLQDWVEAYVAAVHESPVQVFKDRSGIAHRLDKETSGVMLIGKTPESLAELMRQFKDRETHKEYVALVHGMVQPKETTINLPIKRSIENRHKFHVDVDGKPAVTRYRIISNFQFPSSNEQEKVYQDKFTLVRLYPKTGRTHQIRVHMAHIGYPLVGDELYGGRKRVVNDREWCPRHFLHAAAIEFTHPQTKEWLKIEAPLPTDLQQALEYISHE